MKPLTLRPMHGRRLGGFANIIRRLKAWKISSKS